MRKRPIRNGTCKVTFELPPELHVCSMRSWLWSCRQFSSLSVASSTVMTKKVRDS